MKKRCHVKPILLVALLLFAGKMALAQGIENARDTVGIEHRQAFHFSLGTGVVSSKFGTGSYITLSPTFTHKFNNHIMLIGGVGVSSFSFDTPVLTTTSRDVSYAPRRVSGVATTVHAAADYAVNDNLYLSAAARYTMCSLSNLASSAASLGIFELEAALHYITPANNKIEIYFNYINSTLSPSMPPPAMNGSPLYVGHHGRTMF